MAENLPRATLKPACDIKRHHKNTLDIGYVKPTTWRHLFTIFFTDRPLEVRGVL